MPTRLLNPAQWCAAGLLAVAAGIVIQILAGIDYPANSSGPVVTIAAAGAAWLREYRHRPPEEGAL
jgi:hypothetical protein